LKERVFGIEIAVAGVDLMVYICGNATVLQQKLPIYTAGDESSQ